MAHDLVCNVPKLQVRSSPVVSPETALNILYRDQHFQAISFKGDNIGKTRIVWGQDTSGKWAMVVRGRSLYFKLAGKPFNPTVG